MKEKPINATIHPIDNGYLVYYTSRVSSVNGKGTLKYTNVTKEIHYMLISDAIKKVHEFFTCKFKLCED